MSVSIHHSHTSDEWATPQHVFDHLNARYGPFELDVAATPDNAKCARFFTIQDDALSKPWPWPAFGNPPYSQVAEFVEHAIRETQSGRCPIAVLLLKSSTETIWFREAFEHADEVHALSGRLRFGEASEPAPFPSCVIVLRHRRQHTWTLENGTRFTMPKRHGKRPAWYTLKASAIPGMTTGERS